MVETSRTTARQVSGHTPLPVCVRREPSLSPPLWPPAVTLNKPPKASTLAETQPWTRPPACPLLRWAVWQHPQSKGLAGVLSLWAGSGQGLSSGHVKSFLLLSEVTLLG